MKLRRFFASFSIVLLLFSVSVPLCFASNSNVTDGLSWDSELFPTESYSGRLWVTGNPNPVHHSLYDAGASFPRSQNNFTDVLKVDAWATSGTFQYYVVYEFDAPVYHPYCIWMGAVYGRAGGSLYISDDYTGFTDIKAFLNKFSFTPVYTAHDSALSPIVQPVSIAYRPEVFSASLPNNGTFVTSNLRGIWVSVDPTKSGYADEIVTGGSIGFMHELAFQVNDVSFADIPYFYIFPVSDNPTINEMLFDLLDHVISIDNTLASQLPNIYSGITQMLNQLYALNQDTDVIISVLNTLQGLSESQLVQLEKISTSVDAIYFFLTEALKSESEDASQAVQDTVNSIDNSHASEAYWQTSMQGNYDSLDLEHFSFGGITGGIELVGRIFTDMWSAFGEYQILFTFPLVLGIALLVIGRISKFGGGNSSRNKEHKGGEGGA